MRTSLTNSRSIAANANNAARNQQSPSQDLENLTAQQDAQTTLETRQRLNKKLILIPSRILAAVILCSNCLMLWGIYSENYFLAEVGALVSIGSSASGFIGFKLATKMNSRLQELLEAEDEISSQRETGLTPEAILPDQELSSENFDQAQNLNPALAVSIPIPNNNQIQPRRSINVLASNQVVENNQQNERGV